MGITTKFNWLKQSVSRVLFPGRVTPSRVMAIHLGLPLPAASSSQPGDTGGSPLTSPYLALLLTGFTWHPPSPADPVSSYLTLSPLPAEAGGLLSVALIPGVTPAGRYPASYPVEPGLSSLPKEERPPVLLQPNCRLRRRRGLVICGVALSCPDAAYYWAAGDCCSISIRWQWGQEISSSARKRLLYSCGGRCMLHPRQ